MDTDLTSARTFQSDSPVVQRLLRDLNTPWKMWLYFWRQLPTLLFWGVRVKQVDPYCGAVTLPYGWRSQNPFQSIYFAAQCGAAEFSTGLLALVAIHGRGRISMLITGVEAEFVKKANSLTTFTCTEGDRILEAVQRAIDTGEGQVITVTSTGVQANGEVVSRIRFTWSFLAKS